MRVNRTKDTHHPQQGLHESGGEYNVRLGWQTISNSASKRRSSDSSTRSSDRVINYVSSVAGSGANKIQQGVFLKDSYIRNASVGNNNPRVQSQQPEQLARQSKASKARSDSAERGGKVNKSLFQRVLTAITRKLKI